MSWLAESLKLTQREFRSSPSSGVLWMQKMKSHLLRTQSLNVFHWKPGVSQYIRIHAALIARDFFLANFYPFGPFICV